MCGRTDRVKVMDELLTLIPASLSASEQERVERAYAFAEEKHHGQSRNNGTPYFLHVVEVAKNCARIGMDADTIIAALLHDTLEDTDATEEEIGTQFGETVLFLVKGVTKLGKLKYQGRERHVESLRKFFLAIAEDVRVLIIKLADRLHNVQTLEHVHPEKQRRIALETIEVHAALAGRLGMEKLKGELEDHAFPYAFPDDYQKTKEIMDTIVPEAQQTVEHAHSVVEKTLRDFSISHSSVHSRIKYTYSTYRKLLKYKWNAEQVYDIVALRVITDSVADCYQILGLIHMLWKPIPKRIKDYIALPKPNGYQSLHTSVFTEHGVVEVQIRTDEMHREAEMGIASHFVYKEASRDSSSGPTSKKWQWLDELKELHDVVRDPSAFLQQLQLDFFKDRIFVFSPKGDVIDLPEGTSPIDFAYAIHSDVGHATSAARINGKMASLGDTLHNGDIVEIITGKNAKPSNKWVDYAKTNSARRKIRAYIAEHGGMFERFLLKKN